MANLEEEAFSTNSLLFFVSSVMVSLRSCIFLLNTFSFSASLSFAVESWIDSDVDFSFSETSSSSVLQPLRQLLDLTTCLRSNFLGHFLSIFEYLNLAM